MMLSQWLRSVCYGAILSALGAHASAPEKVVLYGDAAYPPYSFVEDGQFRGLYIDILQAAAKRLQADYAIELVPVPWKRGLDYLKNGRGLALFPPGLKKERDYIAPYSVSLFRETVVVFCNDDVMLSHPKRFPDDFIGRSMGVNAGFLLSDKLTQAATAGQVKIDPAPNNDSNLKKLAIKRIDCYVSDRGAALYSAKQLRIKEINFTLELQEAAILSEEDTFLGYSRYFNAPYKQDFIDKMDAALSDMKSKGEISKIIKAYFH
ncbi:substrate-binding periplasmic protein [Undibacterium sp. Ren11W]|uniref:substrate-binding periplasmic protein n=1 Tax=Undibacterium sp. Ren11W TaxID=3413045 RepID=UPI003BF27B26